jgi:toxin ParE1/3/4
MAQVIKSPQAKIDLEEIWVYIAQRNFDAADELLDTFDRKLRLLAESSGLGPARDELRPGLRSYPVGKYLLFYSGIEVERVVHGARNLRQLFKPGSADRRAP